ncbi:DUF262 domain-containing protein [Treponema parvum]|uniref:DUF262 domain-containing protein n=1 Tax=Treponema parvum TaxID=138851 RepID=A0A975IE01_9SPIR|nr:DUF262 domain-containing protein [Treponema parvum]QTQ13530.1 DUF262 domain-containing protein [Treponema parvum]
MESKAVASSSIRIVSVNDLFGKNFYIPSYQRGYRWGKNEITDLLEDLYEYADLVERGESSEFYCLQPLVVKEKEWKSEGVNYAGFEVIDGQQRLTSIYILLSYLAPVADVLGQPINLYSLKYETRPNCELFFSKKLFTTENKENIDFLHISNVYNCIEKWFEKNPPAKVQILNLFLKQKKNAVFIWYAISEKENAYDVFKRLNSGKIKLSDAELVKALILKENNSAGDDKFNQSELSSEWNEIEKNLHDDPFWYFINPNPESVIYNATRMDYVLELSVRTELKENYERKLEVQTHLVFVYYSRLIKNEGWENAWHKIQNVYRTIKTWFTDRSIYHYVGYLINRRGENKMTVLCSLLQKYQNLNKSNFENTLKQECRKSLFGENKKEISLGDLRYPVNNNQIHNCLLLFNLATTQNQISEMSRYPFDQHFQATKSKWSLEHIHAQNERKAEWSDEEISKLKAYLKNLTAANISELGDYIDGNTIKDEGVYNAIIGAFMGEAVTMEKHDDGTIVFNSDFSKDDSLMNMALLQGDKNAAFNNKVYPEKKNILAEYENAERRTYFVPICTRNVFFKHYSPSSTNCLMWDKEAGIEYVSAMTKVIANYIGAEALLSPKDSEQFNYGLKIKA